MEISRVYQVCLLTLDAGRQKVGRRPHQVAGWSASFALVYGGRRTEVRLGRDVVATAKGKEKTLSGTLGAALRQGIQSGFAAGDFEDAGGGGGGGRGDKGVDARREGRGGIGETETRR